MIAARTIPNPTSDIAYLFRALATVKFLELTRASLRSHRSVDRQSVRSILTKLVESWEPFPAPRRHIDETATSIHRTPRDAREGTSMRRLARRFVSAVGAGTAVSLIPFGASAAWAACTGSQYRYAGQVSPSDKYEGLERFISRTSPTVHNSTTDHEIFWLGMEEYGTNICSAPGGITYCWLQAGHGIGQVGTAHTTTQRLYYEFSGVDGFGYFPDFPTFAAVGADDFYTVYNDGIRDPGGYPYFEAWTNAGGLQQMTYAALEQAASAAESDAEAEQQSTVWPSIGGNAAFGTNGGLGYSSSYSLFKSPDGSSWDEWTEVPSLICSASPYTRTAIHNYSAFYGH